MSVPRNILSIKRVASQECVSLTLSQRGPQQEKIEAPIGEFEIHPQALRLLKNTRPDATTCIQTANHGCKPVNFRSQHNGIYMFTLFSFTKFDSIGTKCFICLSLVYFLRFFSQAMASRAIANPLCTANRGEMFVSNFLYCHASYILINIFVGGP